MSEPNYQMPSELTPVESVTAPTSPASAERETPESDYLDASLRALCKEMASDGNPMDDMAWTEIYEAAIEGAKDTERHLRATNADLTRRLDEARADKERLDWILELIRREGTNGLTDFQWSMVDDDPDKEEGDMDEDDPERLTPVLDRAAIDRAKDGKGAA